MEKLFIPVLLGTSRQGRLSEPVAKFVVDQLVANGFTSELVDPRDYLTAPVTEACMPPESSKAWTDLMARADGLMIVSPEYNHGYPGELKLMLDELDKEPNRKVAAVCGVSDGPVGGARMVEGLHQVLIDLKMYVLPMSAYFSNVKELFDEKGVVRDTGYTEKLQKMCTEIAWWGGVLKTARQKV